MSLTCLRMTKVPTLAVALVEELAKVLRALSRAVAVMGTRVDERGHAVGVVHVRAVPRSGYGMWRVRALSLYNYCIYLITRPGPLAVVTLLVTRALTGRRRIHAPSTDRFPNGMVDLAPAQPVHGVPRVSECEISLTEFGRAFEVVLAPPPRPPPHNFACACAFCPPPLPAFVTLLSHGRDPYTCPRATDGRAPPKTRSNNHFFEHPLAPSTFDSHPAFCLRF